MSITISEFGKVSTGIAKLYVMKNQAGMTAAVSDMGAVLVNLYVPDKDGNMRDVVLGYDEPSSYEEINSIYLGSTIGRNGNRIGGARFTLNGAEYTLDQNDGRNNLHSGVNGYEKRMWKVADMDDSDTPSVTFELESPHMDQGYPGNATVKVTYALTADNKLSIHYDAVSDQDTIFNMTNHSYFNLNGAASGTILDHQVQILADKFTWADEESIPTGELVDVEGTPMDFREFHAIGERIEEDYQALKFGGGYDHNYVVNPGRETKTVARMKSPESGILMEVTSDLPGMQLYTGNFLEGDKVGKNGCRYGKRTGCCFETQFHPDAINHPEFEQPVCKAGEHYLTTTTYGFRVE